MYSRHSRPLDSANTPDYLKATARDNVQLLLAKLFVLPTERIDNVGVLATLPAPTTRIPREKPIPRPKALTKWEQYAQLKGIHKKKKGRMVFDDDFGEWRPRWGYKRANNTLDKGNWVIEHKGSMSTNELTLIIVDVAGHSLSLSFSLSLQLLRTRSCKRHKRSRAVSPSRRSKRSATRRRPLPLRTARPRPP